MKKNIYKLNTKMVCNHHITKFLQMCTLTPMTQPPVTVRVWKIYSLTHYSLNTAVPHSNVAATLI